MKGRESVVVVGAGPVGSLLAIALARRGYAVEVFERRPDMRVETISAGRSINLAMSVRGLHALDQAGLAEQALAQCVPMRGRLMHALTGETAFQNYGKNEDDCIYSVSRGGLNKLLISAAEATGQVRFRFNERLAHYDSASRKLSFVNEKTGARTHLVAEVVIGADGSASILRQEVVKESNESLLDYGYKEIELPAGPNSTHLLEKNALHIWPRGTFMMIALPNFDGSFTCTLFLPMEGAQSFASLKSKTDVHSFFERSFPDLLKLLPKYEQEFFENPTGRMVTVKCAPWNLADQALLIGDAAHAVVPFYGQGMNCGLEDVSILGEGLDQGKTLKQLMSSFSKARKPDADAIADMAIENFIEMRDRVGDPQFLLRKQVEHALEREFPDKFVSRYSLVTFSRAPYRQALAAGISNQKLLDELCANLKSPKDLDLNRARELLERVTK